jgi:uncharacterized membrane protein YdjX (TVP38/TMEM64 family)
MTSKQVGRMRRLLRLLPALILLALSAAAVAGGALRDLSLSGVAAHRAAWAATAQAHPAEAFAAFVAIYALLTSVGLPVAMMLTLAGGLVFGGLLGGAATAVASVTAALIGYAAARSALSDLIQARLADGGRLERLVQALRTRGFWYMLAARLMPAMPFSLVNVGCGVARAPLGTYLAATVAGAIPTSFLYASLGAGLGDSLTARGVADAVRSPAIWLPLTGLAILALMPTILRRRT